MQPRYNLRFLATNDVHYTAPEEAAPHDVLLCIQTGSLVSDEKRLKFSDDGYYLKSYDEMAQLFGHIPGALDNSLLIAEMCEVDLDTKGYHLPLFDVPEGYDAASYLRHLCEEGLAWRYGPERAAADPVVRDRLEHELRIINGMGFATYFLIVWDLCEYARQADIWWNVRGSGAGSLVAYTLGVTGIDPLANGLIFERFLNPGRVSMPDIDLDYPDDRRHEMVEYAVRKYGQDKVAQIITFGTLGARAAVRDVGRALDIPLPEVDAVARQIPAIPGKPVKIDNVLERGHEFYVAELAEQYQKNPQVHKLLDTARQLEGVARHASSHAAGVIISDRPLVEYVPLHKPTSGDAGLGGISSITQWPMEIVEKIGLLKVDFLGLSTLTIMRRAAQLIEERHGVRYTMDNIPYDVGHVGPDPDKPIEAAFAMLGRGDVLGVFQVEGSGMRKLMMDMKPQRFDHIIAAISLYRPGPMENIPEYTKRMHAALAGDTGLIQYHTPELKPILEETYGIFVYQEQIIRVAADLAGYEPGEADMLRKAVAKKKQDLMDEHRLKFTEGAMARGVSREVCDKIWGDIEFFARYGFNKAHAADYAVICCQTAYLKAHYPVEYIAALLTVERDNSEKVAKYIADARRLGIGVGVPSINQAQLDFSIEDHDGGSTIRYGLAAIKNAGQSAMQLIVDERAANGPYRDLADLAERADLRRVGKRALESMVKVGVFDEWGTRPQLLDALDRLMGHSAGTHAAADVGQMTLFELMGNAGAPVNVELLRPADVVPPIDNRLLLTWEKELIGLYLSEHPLEQKLAALQGFINARTVDLDATWGGRAVALAGVVTALRTLTTKKGQPMAFATLEDLEGTIEVVLFPRTWKQYREAVQPDQILLVRGTVQADNNSLSVIANSVHNNLTIATDADRRRLADDIDHAPDLNGPPRPSGGRPGRSNGPSMPPPEPDWLPYDDTPPDDWMTGSPVTAAPPPPPEPVYAAANEAPLPASPDDEDDEGDVPTTFGTPEDDDIPTAPDGAVPLPPPPVAAPVAAPLVAAPAATAVVPSDKAQAAANGHPANGTPTANGTPVANGHAVAKGQPAAAVAGGAAYVEPPAPAPPSPAPTVALMSDGMPNKLLVVEVKASGNWQETCRQAIKLASRFEGNAGLSVRLAGQGMVMDFPNQRTESCAELIEALERLPGIVKVFEA
jgi:DNA polymerase-3 subunit alpha